MLTSRTEYALRALADLAGQRSRRYSDRWRIAEATGLPSSVFLH